MNELLATTRLDGAWGTTGVCRAMRPVRCPGLWDGTPFFFCHRPALELGS